MILGVFACFARVLRMFCVCFAYVLRMFCACFAIGKSYWEKPNFQAVIKSAASAAKSILGLLTFGSNLDLGDLRMC